MSYQPAVTRRSSTTAPPTAIAKDLLFITPNLTPGGISACPCLLSPQQPVGVWYNSCLPHADQPAL